MNAQQPWKQRFVSTATLTPSETNNESRSRSIKTFISRRWRCSLRAFVLSVAAMYFLAMYTFHSNLDERNQRPNQLADIPVDGHLVRNAAVPEPKPVKQQIVFNGGQIPAGLNEADAMQARIVLAQAIRTRDEETFFRWTDSNETHNFDIVHKEVFGRISGTGTFQSDKNVPVNCRNLSDHIDLKPDRFVQIAPEVRLYSAYWDERPNDFDNLHNGSYIRFMAIVTNKANPKLECVFTVPNSALSERYLKTPVKYYEMCENHNRPYGGFIISCSVPEEISEPPCNINVTFSDVDVALVLRTLKPIEPLEERRNFTVCVPPLFGDITRTRLVEFIEVTTVLGADHIMFYVYKVLPDVQELLDKYTAMDGGKRVSVVSWPLETVIDSAMWYHGQSVAIQDCLYRNMATSKYVAFNDIDEYIVPHRVMSWSEMSQQLEQPTQCAFQFQSSFLDASYVNSTFVKEVGMSLDTLTVLQRSSAFNSIRAKCMVKPYLIFEKGIHHISKPIWANLVCTRIDPDVAYLHHYRPCTVRMGGNCNGQTADHSMLRYRQQVIDGLLAVRKRLVHS